MGIGAGIAGAAVIGGAAGIAGSALSASAEARSVRRAIDFQKDVFKTNRRDLGPYRAAGYGALDILTQMFLGLPPGRIFESRAGDPRVGPFEAEGSTRATRAELLDRLEKTPQFTTEDVWRKIGRESIREQQQKVNPAWLSVQSQLATLPEGGAGSGVAGAGAPGGPDYSAFFKSPGYEFRLEEGFRGLERAGAVRGSSRGGNTLRDLITYGQGLASSEFNQYANRLSSLAGLGQGAVNTGVAAGVAAGGQVGQSFQALGAARGSAYSGLSAAGGVGFGYGLQALGAGNPAFGSAGGTSSVYGTPPANPYNTAFT